MEDIQGSGRGEITRFYYLEEDFFSSLFSKNEIP